MLGQKRHEIGGMDMDEVQTELNGTSVSANNADGVVGSGINQLRGWNPSSRIIRVSRASGGKDRHSKVWTSKGLRDRRVRLSVSTAIQFYDLQDRLGYDQPSKAVEWLIKAAADSISELPSINTAFPDTPSNNNLQVSDEKMGSNGNENQQMDLEIGQNSQSQALSLSKSACSSTSDTSKNSSGLSLSRSEIRGSNRAKARERAKERAVKEKENAVQQNPFSSSFTKLLTGNFADGNSPAAGYLSHHQGYNGQFQLGNSNFPHHHHRTMSIVPPFSITGANQNHNQNHHQEALHQFSFVPESLFHPAGSAGEYGTLNFSISGYNRGTLQSNSPSLFSNTVQRIPTSSTNMDGSNIPFFIGSSAGSAFENHHHQPHQFMTGPDGSLQLYYGDGSSNHKDKGKN